MLAESDRESLSGSESETLPGRGSEVVVIRSQVPQAGDNGSLRPGLNRCARTGRHSYHSLPRSERQWLPIVRSSLASGTNLEDRERRQPPCLVLSASVRMSPPSLRDTLDPKSIDDCTAHVQRRGAAGEQRW